MHIERVQGQARNGMAGVLEVPAVHMVVVHVVHLMDWTMLGGLIIALFLHVAPVAVKGQEFYVHLSTNVTSACAKINLLVKVIEYIPTCECH